MADNKQESRSKEEIYKNHLREHYSDSFPPEKLEEWVNYGLTVTEELKCIYESMTEYAEQCFNAAREVDYSSEGGTGSWKYQTFEEYLKSEL